MPDENETLATHGFRLSELEMVIRWLSIAAVYTSFEGAVKRRIVAELQATADAASGERVKGEE